MVWRVRGFENDSNSVHRRVCLRLGVFFTQLVIHFLCRSSLHYTPSICVHHLMKHLECARRLGSFRAFIAINAHLIPRRATKADLDAAQCSIKVSSRDVYI
jgi:hypothetical protein